MKKMVMMLVLKNHADIAINPWGPIKKLNKGDKVAVSASMVSAIEASGLAEVFQDIVDDPDQDAETLKGGDDTAPGGASDDTEGGDSGDIEPGDKLPDAEGKEGDQGDKPETGDENAEPGDKNEKSGNVVINHIPATSDAKPSGGAGDDAPVDEVKIDLNDQEGDKNVPEVFELEFALGLNDKQELDDYATKWGFPLKRSQTLPNMKKALQKAVTEKG